MIVKVFIYLSDNSSFLSENENECEYYESTEGPLSFRSQRVMYKKIDIL